MPDLRTYVDRALGSGRISSAAYRLLTGLAMLVVASLLWSARGDDRAAGPVALALATLGVVLLGRAVLASRGPGSSR